MLCLVAAQSHNGISEADIKVLRQFTPIGLIPSYQASQYHLFDDFPFWAEFSGDSSAVTAALLGQLTPMKPYFSTCELNKALGVEKEHCECWIFWVIDLCTLTVGMKISIPRELDWDSDAGLVEGIFLGHNGAPILYLQSE